MSVHLRLVIADRMPSPSPVESIMKLRFIASLAALLAVVASIDNVAAQSYPSRPIKLVVPYEGNVYFGEDLMEIPFMSPSAAKLD